jgi:hypothetical protein
MKNLDGKGYSKDRFTTVFAGFSPVTNPRLVCVIVIPEPMIRLHYGGYVCGPVFQEVVKASLTKLNVPEEPMDPNAVKEEVIIAKEEKKEEEKIVKPVEEDVDTIVEHIEADKLDETLQAMLVPIGNLPLVKADGAPINDSRILPDFTGMTKAQVREELINLGLSWDPQGMGRVVAQEPPAGTPIPQVAMCSLVFSQNTSPITPITAEEEKDKTQSKTDTPEKQEEDTDAVVVEL